MRFLLDASGHGAQHAPVLRLGRTPRQRLAARLLLYGGLLVVGLPWSFSQMLIGTQRIETGRPPAGFTEDHVNVDGLKLRVWHAPGDPLRAGVVATHGLGDSIDSYAEVAERLHARGHPVVLVDMRGHGGSEGRYTTLGGLEARDVRAAVDLLRARGGATRGLVLMGWSMGSVAVLRAGVGQPDLRAVVAEAPFDTYRNTVAHHGQLLFHIPRWVPLLPLTVALSEWRAGFRADDVDAVAASRALTGALLAIADGDDPRMPESVVRRVYDAHPGPKEFWLAGGAPHAGALLRADYWDHVLGFLASNGI
jgi:pimeloyl-ACP methyl ester carboxylesterase